VWVNQDRFSPIQVCQQISEFASGLVVQNPEIHLIRSMQSSWCACQHLQALDQLRIT
jgi:hypothetical protein